VLMTIAMMFLLEVWLRASVPFGLCIQEDFAVTPDRGTPFPGSLAISSLDRFIDRHSRKL